jgi:hypothetical protein
MSEVEEAIVEYARAYGELLCQIEWEAADLTAERSFEKAADELIRLGFDVPRQR